MDVTSELYLQLFRSESRGYRVKLRLWDGGYATAALQKIDLFRLVETMPNAKACGEVLFDCLFQGEVREAYRHTQGMVGIDPQAAPEQNAEQLRLRLEIESDSEPGASRQSHARLQWGDLHERVSQKQSPHYEDEGRGLPWHRLPWESLYDPLLRAPLSLATAFSRYVGVPLARRRAAWERPLDMLLLTSVPPGTAPPGMDDMSARLAQTIRERSTRAGSELVRLTTVTEVASQAQFSQLLAEHPYHLIHLHTHLATVGESHYFVMATGQGETQRVPCRAFINALTPSFQRAPFLLFLTVPVTERPTVEALISVAQMCLHAGLQGVVTIQGELEKPLLGEFIQHFYASLFRSGVMDLAMRDARAHLYQSQPESWAWTYPVLYLRTPEAQLFQPLPDALEQQLSR